MPFLDSTRDEFACDRCDALGWDSGEGAAECVDCGDLVCAECRVEARSGFRCTGCGE